MFGPELVHAFGEFKAIWDPQNKMNPHRVVDPALPGENLRMGPSYHPIQVTTHFKFPDDHGSFAYATERCVGVGECRKEDSGTMCPSYMVTKEDMHSTRGRAHLLFEMLQGDPMKGVWKAEPVREALDLCLACKGCKSECPLNVDMATYKAEFLSHYYEGRLRPRHAYAMGWIYWWARIASWMPGLVNAMVRAPGLGKLFQVMGGISTHRKMPAFATETFKDWWRRRPPRNLGLPPVMLWADTFNNHFHPQTLKAAVEVLEDAGFHVMVPRPSLCCGRPLYDFGMLDTAERLLRQILDTLRPEIEAGIPFVGLEPSCVAVFRDELHGLFPMDEDAKRLRDNFLTLAEFLEKKANGYAVPKLRRKALVHGHCHHSHVMTLTHEQSVLKDMGLNFEMLDSGCCGMAGSFGFEASHYDVSVAVGERVLLPAVRQAEDDTLIIADGFSCREQIAGLTGPRRPAPRAGAPDGPARRPARPGRQAPRGRVRAARQVGARADARRGGRRPWASGRSWDSGWSASRDGSPTADGRESDRDALDRRRASHGNRDRGNQAEEDRRRPGLCPQERRGQARGARCDRPGQVQDRRDRRGAVPARLRRDAAAQDAGRQGPLPA